MFVGGPIPALVFEGLTKGNKFIDFAKVRKARKTEKVVIEFINKKRTDIESGPYNAYR